VLIPDVTLLGVVLALAAWRLFAPGWRRGLRVAGGVVGLLVAAAHWALCGFTWQAPPAWLLLAMSVVPPLRASSLRRGFGRLVMASVATTAVGVWIVPAVPRLPPPDGPYAVASRIYRWTDAARDEPRTPDPADRRSVVAQAWYPTAHRDAPRDIAPIAYIDGLQRLPAQVSVMPGFMLRRYGQVDTHAEHGAPLAPNARPWPVVILLPGYGAPRAVYTGLSTRLASRGFVVFALDHPYESAVTELPDGQVVGTRDDVRPGERDRSHYMARQQAVRVADVRFVIDQLARAGALAPTLPGDRIEGARVAVVGHSFGGAAASAALSEDTRVVAAANIDGTPYGDLPARVLTRPFLLLQSDSTDTHHSDFFVDGNGRLLANMTAPGFHYTIARANHYSFTDAPFFLAPPGRWLLAQVMGGGRGPAATHQVTADLLAAFLAGPLTGAPGDVAATAARYAGVTGGAVTRK